jgi:hypothetical protein
MPQARARDRPQLRGQDVGVLQGEGLIALGFGGVILEVFDGLVAVALDVRRREAIELAGDLRGRGRDRGLDLRELSSLARVGQEVDALQSKMRAVAAVER